MDGTYGRAGASAAGEAPESPFGLATALVGVTPGAALRSAPRHGRMRRRMPSEPTVGSIFAGHRIEAVAGRGGMGVVFRATDLALERPVALKLIAADAALDPVFRARFEIECRAAAAIDHPHAVEVFHAGEVDGVLFVTMRYVEGTDLGALLAERQAARDRAGGRPRRAGRGRARRGARARAGPSRRQADERADRVPRRDRARVPDRLRPDEAAGVRGGPDAAGLRDGHRGLHGARAGARRRRRRPRRRLRPRLRALQDADRHGAVRPRERPREDAGAPARPAAVAARGAAGPAGAARRGAPAALAKDRTERPESAGAFARPCSTRSATARPRRPRPRAPARCASSSPRTPCCCAPASSTCSRRPGFDVVAEAGDAEELLAAVRTAPARRGDHRHPDAADPDRGGPQGRGHDPRGAAGDRRAWCSRSTSRRPTRPSCSATARRASATCSRTAWPTRRVRRRGAPGRGRAARRSIPRSSRRCSTAAAPASPLDTLSERQRDGARPHGRGPVERARSRAGWTSPSAPSSATSARSSPSSGCRRAATGTGACWRCSRTCGRRPAAAAGGTGSRSAVCCVCS